MRKSFDGLSGLVKNELKKEPGSSEVYIFFKLNRTKLVQQISYKPKLGVYKEIIQAVFYDVTTIYFEIEREDEFRETGFSKEGKHQHLKTVLALKSKR